jgi:GNAT superfamily N-acetyltransferase
MKISRAKRDHAGTLFDLLCSAHAEIKLADRVCDAAHREWYLSWMGEKCVNGRVLVAAVANEIVGFLMFDGMHVIEYVVVDELHRRKGIGGALVRRFVGLIDDHAHLRAEARNPASRHMLEKCGFIHKGEYDHTGEFPVLVRR